MNAYRRSYHFIAILMACLMFFTSAGFTMDMHYCGGDLKSVSFFGKAKNCHDLKAVNGTPKKHCRHHQKMKVEEKGCSEEKGCCSNTTLVFQSDQDQKTPTNNFVVSKQSKQFLIAYCKVSFVEELGLQQEVANFAIYKPPLIQKDIPILHQTFLL